MKTNRKTKFVAGKTAKDRRTVYTNHRVDHEGQFWIINAKANPDTKKLKVYRISGDVSNPSLVREALALFANSEALEVA